MALRAPRRLLTAVLAGGLVTGSLLLGAGSALAAPSAGDDVVEARCGQTVRAEPGQTIKVIPELGLPFERTARTGMDPISQVVGGIGGLLCRVQVQVVEPVAAGVAQAAPPLRPATDQLSRGTGAVLDPTPQSRATTPRSQAAVVPPAAAVPTFTPQQAAAAAPAFAPAFGTLPSSFLKSATGPAPGLATYDPKMLLGSAFPGLRAGAPAYLGYDAASAVTTASQVQALPVDGLTDGGVGVPALIAVLALSGVAAFTVRRIVLGKAPVAASSVAPAAPVTDEPAVEAEESEEAAEAELEDLDDVEDEDAGEDATTAAPRTPVPA
ncbi:hypothetical protein EV188_103553 [Actinomycetospora succinea]|uniref:Uncharacterized protein n=1 Tax=Actinomycetospora succinea TaxID=663603 RepID=A0A4R6VI25_9PSEU|nr:hypothetical protein [Actinomycetospora succinea]TDQ61047.1 hypothetical protein EV188_103553 [Actinomycetospora succinea]